MALTGRFNFRHSTFGRLILEVEEEVKPLFGGDKRPPKRRWRRATLMDLAQPEMRALIDLRFQPQYVARTAARVSEPLVATSRPEEAAPATPPAHDGAGPRQPTTTTH